MSTTTSNEIFNVWARCPADILLIILEKLDSKSLFYAMCVNVHWKEMVEYYCRHYNKWRKVIGDATNHKTIIFKEKSNLGNKGIVLNARSWYNIKSACISLNHQYDFECVKDICVYKDNLIVLTNDGMKYYNLETCLLLKTIDSSCVNCVETSSFIVEFTRSDRLYIGNNMLTVMNKLHHKTCICVKPTKHSFSDVRLWRIFYKYCYVMDTDNVLRRYKVDKCQWSVQVMTDYDRYEFYVCSMNIHQRGIYVLMRNGNIFHIDCYGWENGRIYQFQIPMYYLETEPYMFHIYSVVCAVSPEKDFQIAVHKEGQQVLVSCPGLTCAVEHGYMLLLGYENGKIEIFRTTNLVNNLKTPELQFNLQSYTESLKNKIIAIDVYEDKDRHHIFAATESNVYEFFIFEKVIGSSQ